jgi:acyl-CoA thioesterase
VGDDGASERATGNGERFEFDRAVGLEPASPDLWRGLIDPGWNIGDAPNGGYLVAIGVGALARSLPHPDPFAVSAHFPSRARPGPVEVGGEVIRSGRTHSTGQARLLQGGEVRVALVATFGDLEQLDGPTVVTEDRPSITPPDGCVRAAGPPAPEMMNRFDLRLTPESAMWAIGRPSGEARMEGWIRFADGRDPDVFGLVVMCDAFPPTVLNVVDVSWAPTIEYTVHVRGRPEPGWLQCRFTTRYLIDGYLEEDGEVWDGGGRLVALSRQLARVQR